MNAKDYKWLIPSGLASQSTEKNLWDKDHESYSENIFSLTRKKWKQADGETKLNSQIFFETVDSTQLTQEKPDWAEKFDYILVVNSVVSGEDAINRQMLKEFYNVLKPRGKVYGFFPIIFDSLELAYLYSPKACWLTDGSMSLPESAYYDRERNDRQIHYTPLRLNRIFKEAGFKRLSFEVYFTDSDILMESLKQLEGIDDPDICLWEFLVRLEKQCLVH